MGGVVFALPTALVLRRVWIHQAVAGAAWTGAAAACAGLAVFIVAAEPRGGRPGATAGHWAVAIAGCLAVVAVLVIIDPVVSVALSVWLFGEYFVMNAAVLAAAAAGFCVMCAGVVVMSLTAPATLQADDRPDLARPG